MENVSKIPEIILSISWKGVQFADASSKVRREVSLTLSLVCMHLKVTIYLQV